MVDGPARAIKHPTGGLGSGPPTRSPAVAHVHSIGAPENDSEAKAIRRLAEALTKDYFVFHNFELTTGNGLPYEYDVVVLGDFAVWHVEVKGYRGRIQGTKRQWQFENGGVMPSPIPLANKKTKILAGALRRHDRRLQDVWVETTILLTDDRAQIRLHDEQADRVITLPQVLEHFTDPKRVPGGGTDIRGLQDAVAETILGSRPRQRVQRIGLYDIEERISQNRERTVFLGRHRYIRTRPQTILKVYHFDLYSKEEERRRQVEAIFHDQDAMRLLGAHPNLIRTGDMFAWGADQFVLPTEYIEEGRPLREAIDEGKPDSRRSWRRKAMGIMALARGLQHCHEHGVIHRDVRPRNVVVAPRDDQPVIKLVNFDLALIRSNPDIQRPRRFLERVDRRFVAPEVLRDPESADERSDIYSLGISVYEVLTGTKPYEDVEALEGETPLDRERLLEVLSTPGSESFMESPRDVVDVLTRMCAQDPDARYPNLGELLEDLAILA